MRGFDGGGDFELAVGEVTGYRWWVLAPERPYAAQYRGGPGLLLGATGRQIWHDGVNEAACNFNRQHWPPVLACGCGFWGYFEHTPHDLGLGGVPVTGAIEGFGHTLIGNDGFRCQQARIVALHVPLDGVLRPMQARVERRHPASSAIMLGGARLQPGGQETFAAITGHSAVVKLDPASVLKRGQEREREMRAAGEVAWKRVGEVEEQLGQAYPEAQICATLPYLKLKYPPTGGP